jgi:GTP-binding protein YchF
MLKGLRVKVAIIGLRQVGKTTVLGALTGAHGAWRNHHHAEGVAPGMVKVPDERLHHVAQMCEPERTVFATIEFEDVTGMFSHLTGQGSGGPAVAAARDADAILMVVRAFDSPHVPAPLGRVDPQGEYDTMRAELLLADLQVIENRIEAVHKSMRKPGKQDALGRELALLERCRRAVEREEGLRGVEMTEAEAKELRSYAFLTLKPPVCLLNIGEEHVADPPRFGELEALVPPPVKMCAKLEDELMELDEQDRAAFMDDAGLRQMAAAGLIRACFEAAGLVTFFTAVGSKEVHAWIAQAGSTAPQAAGKVHSDMEHGFIRAEVVSYEDLAACGSLKEARAHGKMRMEGKDYVVRDGDVITFHFSR